MMTSRLQSADRASTWLDRRAAQARRSDTAAAAWAQARSLHKARNPTRRKDSQMKARRAFANMVLLIAVFLTCVWTESAKADPVHDEAAQLASGTEKLAQGLLKFEE